MPYRLRRFFAGLVLLIAAAASAAAAQLSDSDARQYRSAFSAAKAGDWAAAQREAAHGHDAGLAAAIQWIVLMRGGGSFSDIAAFIAAHPDWPGQNQLRKRAEEDAGGVPDATLLAWFADHPPLTQGGKLRQAALWLDHGKRDAGLQSIREVWIDGEFSKSDEKSFLQHYHSQLRAADHEARLDRLLWDGQREDARRMLPRVPNAYRALGEARLALASLEAGTERLVARVPAELQRDPGLVYERVRWRVRKEHYDDAIPLLEAAPKELGRPEAWAVEREILARYALANGKPAIAYRIASQSGLTFGRAFRRARIHLRLGGAALSEASRHRLRPFRPSL